MIATPRTIEEAAMSEGLATVLPDWFPGLMRKGFPDGEWWLAVREAVRIAHHATPADAVRAAMLAVAFFIANNPTMFSDEQEKSALHLLLTYRQRAQPKVRP